MTRKTFLAAIGRKLGKATADEAKAHAARTADLAAE
jgi:hypothetical protein